MILLATPAPVVTGRWRIPGQRPNSVPFHGRWPCPDSRSDEADGSSRTSSKGDRSPGHARREFCRLQNLPAHEAARTSPAGTIAVPTKRRPQPSTLTYAITRTAIPSGESGHSRHSRRSKSATARGEPLTGWAGSTLGPQGRRRWSSLTHSGSAIRSSVARSGAPGSARSNPPGQDHLDPFDGGARPGQEPSSALVKLEVIIRLPPSGTSAPTRWPSSPLAWRSSRISTKVPLPCGVKL